MTSPRAYTYIHARARARTCLLIARWQGRAKKRERERENQQLPGAKTDYRCSAERGYETHGEVTTSVTQLLDSGRIPRETEREGAGASARSCSARSYRDSFSYLPLPCSVLCVRAGGGRVLCPPSPPTHLLFSNPSVLVASSFRRCSCPRFCSFLLDLSSPLALHPPQLVFFTLFRDFFVQPMAQQSPFLPIFLSFFHL